MVRVVDGRGRALGHALYSDRSEIALRMLSRGTRSRRSLDALARRGSTQAFAFREPLAIDATAYRLVHGEADLLPSLIVDRLRRLPRACRRCRRGPIACCRRSRRLLVELRGAGRHPRAQRSARARCSRGSSSTSRCSTARCRRRSRSARGRSPTRSIRITARRPGCSSISARTASPRRATRAGRLLDAFSYNGGFALALAPRRATRCWRSTSPRRPSQRIRENAARNGLAQRRGARDERVRRAARARAARRALRHDRARPAGVREEQGVGPEGAVRLQGNQPARAEAAGARRVPGHLQLFVQRQRGGVRRRASRRPPSTRAPTSRSSRSACRAAIIRS